MTDTSALFGSYASRFPEALTTAIEIQRGLFYSDASLVIEEFAEPEAAKEIRLRIWREAVKKKYQDLTKQGKTVVEGRDGNDMYCLYEFNSGGEPRPLMHAGPLWTFDCPVQPLCAYNTDWTYFQAGQNPEYIEALKNSGLEEKNVPLMVGMHIESPKVPWLERPSTVQGRPGEKHPPSTSMRLPSPRLTASTFLFTAEHLGQLDLLNFDDVLAECTIALGQRSTFGPPSSNKPHPYLADYRFIFA